MYLWGVAPFVAAAFMLSSPGLAATTAQPASGTTLTTTSAVLTQVGVQTWETTVQLSDSGSGCPPSKGQFALETTPPDQVLPASKVLQLTGSSKSSVSTCTIPLTVSRTVNLVDYLLVPAAAGLGFLFLLLALVFCFVTARDWDGSRMRPRLFKHNTRFWRQSVLASGAWTANDSWATNISASVAILGSVFGITSAANSPRQLHRGAAKH